jgi:hypothetical protein
MLSLFQCSSIATIFVVLSFRVQVFEVRSAALPTDGLAPDQTRPHSSLVEPTIYVSLNNGRVVL